MAIKKPEGVSNEQRPRLVHPRVWRLLSRIADVPKPTWYAGTPAELDPKRVQIPIEKADNNTEA